jgi:hypothetical protein
MCSASLFSKLLPQVTPESAALELKDSAQSVVSRDALYREVRPDRALIDSDLMHYSNLNKALQALEQFGAPYRQGFTQNAPTLEHAIYRYQPQDRDLQQLLDRTPRNPLPQPNFTHDGLDSFLVDLGRLIDKYEKMPKPSPKSNQPNITVDGGDVTVSPDGTIRIIGGHVEIHQQTPRPERPFEGGSWAEFIKILKGREDSSGGIRDGGFNPQIDPWSQRGKGWPRSPSEMDPGFSIPVRPDPWNRDPGFSLPSKPDLWDRDPGFTPGRETSPFFRQPAPDFGPLGLHRDHNFTKGMIERALGISRERSPLERLKEALIREHGQVEV